MKKFILSLTLVLMLVGWGWQGYQGFGVAPARGEMPPPPPGALCDPYYYNCDYDNYYSAPYADPGTQFFYYAIPWAGEELEEQHERREYRGPERYEHRGHEGGHGQGGHYERH